VIHKDKTRTKQNAQNYIQKMEMGWTPGKNEGQLGPRPNGKPQRKRKLGRPKMRWSDNITKHVGMDGESG